MTNRLMYAHMMTIGLLLLASVILSTAQAQSGERPFFFGVDLSYVNEMDDCGAVYRENGQPRDAFALFAEHGATLVRARLWHNPDWTAYSTLEDVKRTFARAHEQGMATLLDFHYSDNWADPGRQEIPAAWAGLTDTGALADALYDYTYGVLRDLHNADLTPAFVQVGNETNSGLLKREAAQDWNRDAVLFNAGIRAVRDFGRDTSTSPQIILHVAQPENTGWWFTEAEHAGITDFDVIGISYYPQWSTFSIADIGTHASYLRQRFGKAVMVMETAYGWTREAAAETANNILNQGLRGYPFSPEGQRRFMTDLTQSLISNGALGVVYWEPAWVSTECSTRWGQGSHWENATFFDFQNNNELLEGIGFLSHDYLYPAALVDGVIEDAYGDPAAEDSTGDVLDNLAEIDLHRLYTTASDDDISTAVTMAGDVYAGEGYYLIYMDTTHDDRGADVDPGNRPVTVGDPHKPEFRLDIRIREERGTVSGSYVLNAWVDDEWQQISFTGGAAIASGDTSAIEVQLSRALLGDPEQLHIAVVSSNRGRANTAGDILGTVFSPSDWKEAVVLDTFFEVPLTL